VIADKPFFEWLEENVAAILEGREEALIHVVRTSCRIKAAIVEQDEKDEGIRGVLNFGHTVGHALEAATGYGAFRHGEAVAIGMVAAARISCQMGLCNEEVPARLEALLQRIGLPTALNLKPEQLKETIGYDKKIKNNMSYFVLTKDLGSVTVAPVFDPLEALEGLSAT